jgi:hypothetical protein
MFAYILTNVGLLLSFEHITLVLVFYNFSYKHGQGMGYFLEFSFEFGCGIGHQANFCLVSFSLTHTHTYY